MTADPRLTDCLLWIYDSSSERLLVSQGDSAPALPGVTVEDGHHPRVALVRDAARRDWGLDITILRCLADQGPDSDGNGLREYSAYCQTPPATLARGLRWIPAGEGEAYLAGSGAHRGPGSSLDGGPTPGRPNPASRIAWERGAEWSTEAMGWIRRALDSLGLVSAGPPRQIRVWSISTVYAVPTSSRPLYFKASPAFFPAEAALTEDLSRRYPLNTPRVLAADPRRNWMLMADLGNTPFNIVTDETLWQEAVRLIASIQIDYSVRVAGMKTMGLERKPLEDIPGRLALWAKQAGGPGRVPEPSQEDAQLLAQHMDTIQDLCAELASFSIPETLEHGDLDADNIFLTNGLPVLMDWSDSGIRHPFFTMALLGREVAANGPRLEAYLQPWSAFETEARLRRAYQVARPLAALDRALSYVEVVIPNADPNVDRPQMEELRSWYARLALRSLALRI